MHQLTAMSATFAPICKLLIASAISLGFLPAAAATSAVFEFEGHTYRIVTDITDWETANLRAGEMSLNGQAGYLARVDSQRENMALLEALATHVTSEELEASIPDDGSEVPFVWLGGSDIAQEGVWTWSNNGDQFWQGDFNGAPKNGLYSNWGVQPDSGSGAEDGLAFGSVHGAAALELVFWLRTTGYEGHVYFDTFPRNEDPVREAEHNIRRFKALWDRAVQLERNSEVRGALLEYDAMTTLEVLETNA